jgi:hypothetical protein
MLLICDLQFFCGRIFFAAAVERLSRQPGFGRLLDRRLPEALARRNTSIVAAWMMRSTLQV